jgi:hypothetical protein
MPNKRIDLKYEKGKYSFSKFSAKKPNKSKIRHILTEESAQKLKRIITQIRAKNLEALKKKVVEMDRKLSKNRSKVFGLQDKIESLSVKINTVLKKLQRDPKNKNLLIELEHLRKQKDFLQIEFNAIETIIENLVEEKELTNIEISDLKNPNKRRKFKPIRLKKQALKDILDALRILEKNGIISKNEHNKRVGIFLKIHNNIKLTKMEKEILKEQGRDPLFEYYFE